MYDLVDLVTSLDFINCFSRFWIENNMKELIEI